MTRLLVVALGLAAMIAGTRADDFPSRTVSIVVPYAAGGAMDAVGRIVADTLGRQLRVATVVDNRAGGSGIPGMRYVAGAPGDGHVLMISSEVGQAIQPAIDPAFPFDSLNTFTPIALVGTFPHFLVARSSLGVSTVAEYVAYAKANPGKLNFGSNGVGTIAHVGMELFKRKAGIDVPNVPYRGAMAALTDLIAGRVDANIQSLPNLTGHLDNPALKFLAILDKERDKRFPEIPTLLESGYPDMVFVSWTALFGPPNMPPAVVKGISAAVTEAVRVAEVAERLRAVGFDPVGLDAAGLDQFQRSVAESWKRIAQETGIRLER
ncbi:MAG: Bug family tripartite tricarboxylate transporter substrate binding protein [Xanthobacteraceae bacterium]